MLFRSNNVTFGIVSHGDGSAGAPSITNTGDTDTGMYFSSGNEVSFSTGGVNRLTLGNSAVVFNEGMADVDFRVESNGNAHMIFVDGGSNEVGIGTSDPRSPLHVQTSHTSTDVTAANTNSTLSVGNSGSGDGVYNSIKFAGNQQDMYIM